MRLFSVVHKHKYGDSRFLFKSNRDINAELTELNASDDPDAFDEYCRTVLNIDFESAKEELYCHEIMESDIIVIPDKEPV